MSQNWIQCSEYGILEEETCTSEHELNEGQPMQLLSVAKTAN